MARRSDISPRGRDSSRRERGDSQAMQARVSDLTAFLHSRPKDGPGKHGGGGDSASSSAGSSSSSSGSGDGDRGKPEDRRAGRDDSGRACDRRDSSRDSRSRRGNDTKRRSRSRRRKNSSGLPNDPSGMYNAYAMQYAAQVNGMWGMMGYGCGGPAWGGGPQQPPQPPPPQPQWSDWSGHPYSAPHGSAGYERRTAWTPRREPPRQFRDNHDRRDFSPRPRRDGPQPKWEKDALALTEIPAAAPTAEPDQEELALMYAEAPPRIDVIGKGMGEQRRYRVTHITEALPGEEEWEQKLFAGPWRTDREEALDDATKLKFAHGRGGEDAMCRELITLFRPIPPATPCSWSVPEGITGWEFQSRAIPGGLHTQHRSICWYEGADGASGNSAAQPLGGPWRASYQRVEDELLQQFRVYECGGGRATTGAAKVQAFISNLHSSTRLPGL